LVVLCSYFSQVSLYFIVDYLASIEMKIVHSSTEMLKIKDFWPGQVEELRG
jgi:hypothetical protein